MPSDVVPVMEIYDRMCVAAAEALNSLADELYQDSQTQVPRSNREKDATRHPVPLADTGQAPFNSADHTATPVDLVAMVSYGDEEHEYAAVLHEGVATMERESGPVDWQARNYTPPGKAKYLEDPLKAVLPRVEPEVAAYVRRAIGG